MRKEGIIEMEEITFFCISKIKMSSQNKAIKERNRERRPHLNSPDWSLAE